MKLIRVVVVGVAKPQLLESFPGDKPNNSSLCTAQSAIQTPGPGRTHRALLVHFLRILLGSCLQSVYTQNTSVWNHNTLVITACSHSVGINNGCSVPQPQEPRTCTQTVQTGFGSQLHPVGMEGVSPADRLHATSASRRPCGGESNGACQCRWR